MLEGSVVCVGIMLCAYDPQRVGGFERPGELEIVCDSEEHAAVKLGLPGLVKHSGPK